MRYAVRWRCRRCELCYDGFSVEGAEEKVRRAARLDVQDGPVLQIHDCADGSFGVADQVGYVKLPDAHEATK